MPIFWGENLTKIAGESVQKNSQRIWGTFKLSDGTTTHFSLTRENVKNGVSWFQWGNNT
jgi:hypothetical protein